MARFSTRNSIGFKSVGHFVMITMSALTVPSFGSRSRPVVDDESVVIYEQDVHAGFYITVLKSIVKQNHFHIVCGVIMLQTVNAAAPVLVDSHIDVVVFPVYLERFVAYFRHRGAFVGK